MKRHLGYGLLLTALFIIHACGNGTRLQDYEAKNEQEKEIKSLLVEYVTARNNYDVQKMASYLSEDARIGFLDNRTFSKSEFASTFKARDFEAWGKYDCFDPDIKISDNVAEIKMKYKESLLNRGVYRFKMNRRNNRWMITEVDLSKS
jgi:hypothetical protein